MKLYKYGVELFDSKYSKYGGHWQVLGRITRLDYLSISFRFKIGFEEIYYDGYHSILHLGLFTIAWGGRPIKRDGFH